MNYITTRQTKDGITKPVLLAKSQLVSVTPINDLSAPKCIVSMSNGEKFIIEDSYEHITSEITNF